MPEIVVFNRYFGGCRARFAGIPKERLRTFKCNNYMEKRNEKTVDGQVVQDVCDRRGEERA